jgi:hypothetical protein
MGLKIPANQSLAFEDRLTTGHDNPFPKRQQLNQSIAQAARLRTPPAFLARERISRRDNL